MKQTRKLVVSFSNGQAVSFTTQISQGNVRELIDVSSSLRRKQSRNIDDFQDRKIGKHVLCRILRFSPEKC
jgi:hypothetical protein